MQTILVTGGAGFIGYHLTSALLQRGDRVIIVDNFNDYYDPAIKFARIKILKKHRNHKRLKIYKLDISNYKKLAKVFKKHRITKICNLAAQAGVRYSLKDPFRYEQWNNLGMLTLLELARKFKVKDVVYASSSSVYGGNTKIPFSEKDNVDTPISIYAATKKSNELYAYVYHKLYGLNCTGMRFFTVYGPWGRPDMALFKFVKNILINKPIDVYNYGNMKRDFTYVTDIVQGIIAAIDNPFPYEVFNIGNSKPVKLMEFIEAIEKTLGRKAKKRMLPMQKGDVSATYANTSKARRLLDYEPKTDVEEGIRNFVNWYVKWNRKKRS